ncbi:MAG TPA: helix-turn-helix transcriptional regulator [Polyangiaceae bacterium]|jgi:transcriptional regulator with XRE-family HTH domain|nr:helix-turn-helix transcriptional regulator [Polyangiaceae bacterium]
MTSTFETFPCAECGHDVELATGTGRTREYVQGHHLPIPDNFLLPTCTSCGETYTTQEISEALDAMLSREFRRRQSAHFRVLVEILTQRHGVTQKEIVRACGVTPSHLSHVISGKKEASLTLTRLLEAFVASKDEFIRHLENRPWTRATIPLYQVRRDWKRSAAWQREPTGDAEPLSRLEWAS